jgi:hypothetical protein
MTREELTIAAILQELATEYDQIVAEREVMDRVLERKPSRAKNPYAGIRDKLRYDGTRVGWVRLGGGKLIPLHAALQGLRFRMIPSDEEYRGQVLLSSRLSPFVQVGEVEPRLEDAEGRSLNLRDDAPNHNSADSLSYGSGLALGDWFTRVSFEPGDSIIATVRSSKPLTIALEREPKADFRADATREQEREVVDTIAEQLARSRTHMLFLQESILPIYAQAAWRTSYPGRPWQDLVGADPRLQLVDGLYIADSAYRQPFSSFFGISEVDERQWQELDDALLKDITAFQHELRASRHAAADEGLWDGMAPRASTATTLFDPSNGTLTTVYDGPIDALHDYSAAIDERAAQGDYSDAVDDLDVDDQLDMGDVFDLEELDGFEFGDDMLDIEDIEDMQDFLEQNPGLIDATRRLMNALTPEELAQLEAAKTPDEAQRVLSARLNDLLRRDPSLFAALEPPHDLNGNGHSNGHSNGNGNGHGPAHVEDEQDEAWEDEEWEDEEWEDEEEEIDANVHAALERSNELMERFYENQIAQGKSESTASSRTGDLWVYADFLGHYYGRSLDAGDYATLDECMFFFYPRKVLNSSPRDARNMCTSFKQFYAFLRAEQLVPDDVFAQAIWRRRDQAARIVELYGRLDAESPRFGRLFGRLFEPYTA